MANNNNNNNNNNYDKNAEKQNHKNTDSKYTVEEIAHMGGEAHHECRGFQCQEDQFRGHPKEGSMTPHQAAEQPHVCRGLQCLKEEEEGKRVKGQEKK